MTTDKEIREESESFLDEYWDEWKESSEGWGLKSSKPSFYQWCQYDGKFHETTESIHGGTVSLTENAETLDSLYKFEETDRGLWEGQSPRDAISAQSFYTIEGALMHYVDKGAKERAEKEGIDPKLVD